jgi:hypothetical protein
VVGDIGWALLAAVAAVLAIAALIRARREAGVSAVSALLARRRLGAVALFALWCFVGIHLFSRYGVQR